MIITGDCLRMGDAAANQHGVEAEGAGAANVRCKLVTDHYHISGAAASQCLLKNDGTGLAEPVKVQSTSSGITLVQSCFQDQGDTAAGNAETPVGLRIDQIGVGQHQANILAVIEFANQSGQDGIHRFEEREAGFVSDYRDINVSSGGTTTPPANST